MSLQALLSRCAGDGELRAIVLRPSRETAATAVPAAYALSGRGLDGDRSAAQASRLPGGSRRQVTLFQYEHLALLAAWLDRAELDPCLLRRNLVVAGLNLLGAKSPLPSLSLRLRIGRDAVFELTGPCDPCSKMEQALGLGAYNALRGHGGVTARVVGDGEIRVGDRVWVEAGDAEPDGEDSAQSGRARSARPARRATAGK